MVSYKFLDAALNGKISPSILSKMNLYQIPGAILNDAAKYLRMYPLDNLLRHMTTPNANGDYEFLGIPAGNCILLGQDGCLIPEYKPYICAMFPFYFYKLQAHFNYVCPGCDGLEGDLAQREAAGKMIVTFYLEADRHQHEYASMLRQINEKYHPKTIRVKSYYPHFKTE
jgi:Fe-S-cluster containining protein